VVSQSGPVLIDLDDTDFIVRDPQEDVRGQTVVDAAGEEIGKVDGLLVDEEEHRVRFLQVGSGGFLGLARKSRLIPVEAVTSAHADVHVDTTRQTIASSPAYDPELVEARIEDYYAHYGFPPFWSLGPVPPVTPPAQENRRGPSARS
jgi:sporulation protein YlmC with PRC-barrel domain